MTLSLLVGALPVAGVVASMAPLVWKVVVVAGVVALPVAATMAVVAAVGTWAVSVALPG